MRKRTVRLLLVVLALLAASASVATAAAVFPRPATSPPAPAIPAGAVVVKTVAALPGGTYPWVQPRWIKLGRSTRPKPPTIVTGVWVQPPAWIPIG